MPAPPTIVHYSGYGSGVYPYDPEFYVRSGTSGGQYYYKWGPTFAYNSIDSTYEATTQYLFWVDLGTTGNWYLGPDLADTTTAYYMGSTQSSGDTPNHASWTAINTGTGSGPTLSPVSYANFVSWKSGSPEVDGIYTDSGSTYNGSVYFRRLGGGAAFIYWDGYGDWIISTSLGGTPYYTGNVWDSTQSPIYAMYWPYAGASPTPSFRTAPDMTTMPSLSVSGADDTNFNGTFTLGGTYNEYPYWQQTVGPYTVYIFRSTNGAWSMAYILDPTATRIYYLPNSVILPTGTWLPDDGATHPVVDFDSTTTVSVVDSGGTIGVNCDFNTLQAWWNTYKNSWTADHWAECKGWLLDDLDMRGGFVNAQPTPTKHCRIYNPLTSGYLGDFVFNGNYPVVGLIEFDVNPYLQIQGLQFYPLSYNHGGISCSGDISTDNILTGQVGDQEGLLIENCLFVSVLVHITSHLSNITFRRNVAIAQSDTPFFYYFSAMAQTSTQELWTSGWDTIPQWYVRYWNNSTVGTQGGGGGDGCASFAFQQGQSNGVSYDILDVRNNVVIRQESGVLLGQGGVGNRRQTNNFWAAASNSGGLTGPFSSDTGDLVNSPASGWAYPISYVETNGYKYGPDYLTPVVDAYWDGDLRLAPGSPALGLGDDVSAYYTTNALNLPIISNDPGALPRYFSPIWRTADITSNLEVYLKCNDGAGTTVYNTAVPANPGTVSFISNPWSTGGPVWDNCIKGDAAGGQLSVAANVAGNSYDTWTVSVWVKKVTTDLSVFSASGLGGLSTSGGVYAGNAQTHNPPNAFGGSFGSTADTNWHMVTLVKQRNANRGWVDSRLSLYIDAVLQADSAYDSARQYFVGDGGGGAWGGSKNFTIFNGTDAYMQEFRVYSRPLNIYEIHALYLYGRATPTPAGNFFMFF